MLKTELCLGLPGGGEAGEIIKTTGKRGFSETVELKLNLDDSTKLDLKHDNTKNSTMEKNKDQVTKPPAKYDIFCNVQQISNLEFYYHHAWSYLLGFNIKVNESNS